MILALSGGTGGSKMVDGLAQVGGQADLTAVVNTGDDGDFYGLRVCPDLDICTYVLAGVVAERGWGYADDTFRCLEGLATYGREAWFGLGDRDLATHLHRTLRLAEGAALGEVTAEVCARLGVEATLLPMSDEPVRTRITTPGRGADLPGVPGRTARAEEITGIEMDGIGAARPAPGLLEAIATAERIVIAPSSPVVSIGTILAVPGVRDALAARRADCVAVSPIIGGAPVEGPAHRFLAGAGYPECSATQMARIYAGVAGTFVLDRADAAEAPAIAALGVRPVLDRRPDAGPRVPGPAWRPRPSRPGVSGGRLGGDPGEAAARCAAPADPALEAPVRRELQVAMLTDVLAACAGARGAHGGAGGDLRSGRRRAGARRSPGRAWCPTTTPPRGMNAAVSRGLVAVAAEGADAALVLTADLPLARPADIAAIVAAGRPGPSALLVPLRRRHRHQRDAAAPARGPRPAPRARILARHTAQAARRGWRDRLGAAAPGARHRHPRRPGRRCARRRRAGATREVCARLGSPSASRPGARSEALAAVGPAGGASPGDDLAGMLADRAAAEGMVPGDVLMRGPQGGLARPRGGSSPSPSVAPARPPARWPRRPARPRRSAS